MQHLLCKLNHLFAICWAAITENQEVRCFTGSSKKIFRSCETFNKMSTIGGGKLTPLGTTETLHRLRGFLRSEMHPAPFVEGNQGKPGAGQEGCVGKSRTMTHKQRNSIF